MIFYFSGTGNSYCVAKEVSESTNEKLVNITEAWRKNEFQYDLKEGERIGFIYPVHAWAPPTLVKRFIKKLKLTNSKGAYVYSLLTCGDDWEGTLEHLKHALAHIGLSIQGDFKVIMPDNCVMNGAVNDAELAKKKLDASKDSIKTAIRGIIDKKVNYEKIKYSFYKSYIIYAFFQLGKVMSFFKTSDKCTGCGMCEKVCPMKVIKMKEKKGRKVPSWGRGCVQCSACINVCPNKAIDYFGSREKHIRYFNPDYRRELFSNKTGD